MGFFQYFLWFGACLLLAACEGESSPCAPLPGGGQYCLVDGPWPVFSAEQLTTVGFQDQSLTLITRIEAGAEGIRMAGLTPLGQTLYELAWADHRLTATLPPAMAERLNGALFPALLQIATWPADRVRQGLSPDLELRVSGNQRVISKGLQDILIISWEGTTLLYPRLNISAPTAGLRIDARTLDEAAP